MTLIVLLFRLVIIQFVISQLGDFRNSVSDDNNTIPFHPSHTIHLIPQGPERLDMQPKKTAIGKIPTLYTQGTTKHREK
jgi:hypothetical protein